MNAMSWLGLESSTAFLTGADLVGGGFPRTLMRHNPRRYD
jgi:hypothetical protein